MMMRHLAFISEYFQSYAGIFRCRIAVTLDFDSAMFLNIIVTLNSRLCQARDVKDQCLFGPPDTLLETNREFHLLLYF